MERMSLAGATPIPVQSTRAFARALVARAMLRLNDGKLADAEWDLLACHRLGRLVGTTPGTIAPLVGFAIHSLACRGDAALMEHGNLNARQALEYRAMLSLLPSLPVMAVQSDQTERLIYLDLLMLLTLETQKKSPAVGTQSAGVNDMPAENLTWVDEVVGAFNEQYDKFVVAAHEPSVAKRKRELQHLAQALRGEQRWWLMLGPRRMGQNFFLQIIPGFDAASDAENRARMREALDQLGFALVAYRADHAAYPENLNALVPKYIHEVPNDLYNEQALNYKRQGEGFLLYSVGENGADDGGRTFDSTPPADDITLQIPRQQAKQP